MRVEVGSKILDIPDLNKVSKFGMIRGLMFRSRGKSPALSFEFSRPTNMKIHSFFVFFPFLAVWLDENNKIIEKKVIKPFQSIVGITKKFTKLIEIPINDRYSKIINQLCQEPCVKTQGVFRFLSML